MTSCGNCATRHLSVAWVLSSGSTTIRTVLSSRPKDAAGVSSIWKASTVLIVLGIGDRVVFSSYDGGGRFNRAHPVMKLKAHTERGRAKSRRSLGETMPDQDQVNRVKAEVAELVGKLKERISECDLGALGKFTTVSYGIVGKCCNGMRNIGSRMSCSY